MNLEEQFRSASERVKALGDQSNETLLELYALYKQATAGDASGTRPGMFDPVGRAKFDAWSEKKGMSPEEAMRAYVDLVDRLAGGA